MLTLFLTTALQSGKEILEIYKTQAYSVETKEDNSPLTTADLRSNSIINQNLKNLNLPILSEENKAIPFSERKHWNEFILVDPLDGTKEFIKRNGEFTVNIALIRHGLPVMGVIYAPVPDVLYWGSEEDGSWKLEKASERIKAKGERRKAKVVYQTDEYWGSEEDGSWKLEKASERIRAKGERRKAKVVYRADEAVKLPAKGNSTDTIRLVASKSHFSAETEAYINGLKTNGKSIELVSRGSSLKLCMVAEGSADLYPRLGPTMEWDTAAGHAIAKYAGCEVMQFETDRELEYNKEELLNPWFVVRPKGER